MEGPGDGIAAHETCWRRPLAPKKNSISRSRLARAGAAPRRSIDDSGGPESASMGNICLPGKASQGWKRGCDLGHAAKKNRRVMTHEVHQPSKMRKDHRNPTDETAAPRVN